MQVPYRLAVVLLLTPACAAVPPDVDTNPDAYADAIGTVTISAPVMTPVLTGVSPEKSLKLDWLYDEEKLAARILKPDMASSLVQFQALRAAVEGVFAGPQIQSSETRAFDRKIDADGRSTSSSTTTEETVSRATPDVPEDTPFATVPESVDSAMTALLSRVNLEHNLAPDQLATLIAAYKTYMVNLEEYYNLDSLVTGAREFGGSEYVPYKMHFSVTAEPGWYTRYRLMDAVVEGKVEEGIRILTVAPAETAQAIDEFTASLRQLLLTVGVSGSSGPAAVKANIEKVDAVAQRLQGLHTNKTLTVAYPDESTFRIRFRAQRTPTKQGKDLQPISRILTAYVLVRADAAGRSADGMGSQVQTLDVTKSAREANDGSRPARPRTASFEQRAYFAPALLTKQGEFKGTTFSETMLTPWRIVRGLFTGDSTRSGHKRRYPIAFDEEKPDAQHWAESSIEIPVWLGEVATPVRIASVGGDYGFSAQENLAALADVVSHQASVQKAEAAQSAAKTAESTKKAALDAADAALKKKPDDDKLKAARQKASAAYDAAKDATKAKGEALALRKADLTEAEAESRSTWARALAEGVGTIRYEIGAPKLGRDEGGELQDCLVYVRVHCAGLRSDWVKLGEGNQSGVLTIGPLDLSDTASTTTPKVLADFGQKKIAGSIEVVVTPHDVGHGPLPKHAQSVVQGFELVPRSAGASAATKTSASTTAKPKTTSESSPTIALGVDRIELRMTGEPKPESKSEDDDDDDAKGETKKPDADDGKP